MWLLIHVGLELNHVSKRGPGRIAVFIDVLDSPSEMFSCNTKAETLNLEMCGLSDYFVSLEFLAMGIGFRGVFRFSKGKCKCHISIIINLFMAEQNLNKGTKRLQLASLCLLTWINLILIWISNISSHMLNKVWDKITYPFQNFNGTAVEVWDWTSNFAPHFMFDVITCPYWDWTFIRSEPTVNVCLWPYYYSISQEIWTRFCCALLCCGHVIVHNEFTWSIIYIRQGCFAGTGAIVRLPQCRWSKPDGYGKISQCITITKHSKAKTVCIFLWIYCIHNEQLRMKDEYQAFKRWAYRTSRHISVIFVSLLLSEIILRIGQLIGSYFWMHCGVMTQYGVLCFSTLVSGKACNLGSVSISDKTSCCKISRSIKATIFGFRLCQSLRNLTGTLAAPLPICSSSARAIRSL